MGCDSGSDNASGSASGWKRSGRSRYNGEFEFTRTVFPASAMVTMVVINMQQSNVDNGMHDTKRMHAMRARDACSAGEQLRR
jgi:hypothetical protein